MKYLQYIVLTLFVLVLTNSCIKEDFDDCNNVTIYFQYLADGDKDVLSDYMTKVDLYVFDEGGHIKGVGTYHEDELKKFAAIPSFRLRPGQKYKVVAVGNAYDATKVVNVEATNFSDIYIQSPEWGNPDKRVTNHDRNYLGQLEFTMPDQGGTMYRDTVTLYSAHMDVNIEIYGLPAPDEKSRQSGVFYELSIEHSNAQCSFENEINTDEKGTIYPDLIYDNKKKCYRTDGFRLFRMDDQFNNHHGVESEYCEHTLVLRDLMAPEGAAPLFTGKLYNYITANEKVEELVVKQEAILPVELRFHNLHGEITIPEWVVVDGEPEWN